MIKKVVVSFGLNFEISESACRKRISISRLTEARQKACVRIRAHRGRRGQIHESAGPLRETKGALRALFAGLPAEPRGHTCDEAVERRHRSPQSPLTAPLYFQV